MLQGSIWTNASGRSHPAGLTTGQESSGQGYLKDLKGTGGEL